MTPKEEKLNQEIIEARKKAKLDSWTQFVEELRVPSDLMPGILTGRSGLISAAVPRALTVEECRDLYKLIGGIVATNQELRQHAEQLAQLVKNWGDAFTTLYAIGRQIDHFANFRPFGEEPERR